MIRHRPAATRGHTRLDWLDSRHAFSFGDWWDAAWPGFGALRVLNEDRVAPGAGFGRHGHRDMEIVTWVLAGALRHEDSLGNGTVIRPGDVQRMRAGTGVLHSEWNASATEPVHFLQMWIEPTTRGVPPGYAERQLAVPGPEGGRRLIVSPDGREGSVDLLQDACIEALWPARGAALTVTVAGGRRSWLQLARGAVRIDALELAAGDAAFIEGPATFAVVGAAERSELLAFDLPA